MRNGQDALAVGTKASSLQGGRAFSNHREPLACLHIPDTAGLVPGDGEKATAVWAERDPDNAILVTAQDVQFLSGAHVPNSHHSIGIQPMLPLIPVLAGLVANPGAVGKPTG